MQIVRKKLTPDEITPPGTRYNPDCDCVQQTPDGGTTWIDAPGLDPRTSPGFKLPPDPTADPECDGAARMTAAIKGLVNGYLGTASILEAINALLGIVLVALPGYGIVVDVIIAAVGALVVIGTLAIIAAMTDEVYATLACILSCHVGADGQIDQAGVDAAFVDVSAQLTGVAVSVIGEMFNVLGANGLSNASVLRDETGDCSDCNCAWGASWDLCADVPLPWTLIYGTQTPTGVEMVNEGGWASVAQVELTLTTTGSTIIDSIGAWFIDEGTIDNTFRLYVNDVYVGHEDSFTTGFGQFTGLAYAAGTYHIQVLIVNGGFVDGHLTGVRLSGSGTNPFTGVTDIPPACQPE